MLQFVQRLPPRFDLARHSWPAGLFERNRLLSPAIHRDQAGVVARVRAGLGRDPCRLRCPHKRFTLKSPGDPQSPPKYSRAAFRATRCGSGLQIVVSADWTPPGRSTERSG
jgi:hypothetical protein